MKGERLDCGGGERGGGGEGGWECGMNSLGIESTLAALNAPLNMPPAPLKRPPAASLVLSIALLPLCWMALIPC
jgi:hypothetical protein